MSSILKKLTHAFVPRKAGFTYKGPVNKNTVTIGENVVMSGVNEMKFPGKNSVKNVVSVGKNVLFRNTKIVFKGSGNTLIIEDNVKITGHVLIVGKNRVVKIGENTTIAGAYILSRGKNVTIGKNCMLSREIEIRSTDVHHIYDCDSHKKLNPPGDVVIEDRVWVGARALISKGAYISARSVVGAASFVNKKFTEKNVVIAGVPAKIVRRNIYWKR